MNAVEISRAIITGKFSSTELSVIVDAIKFARAEATKQNVGQMVIGTNVKFRSDRHGLVTGKVVSVSRTKIVVESGRTRWTVPASMLEFA